MTVYYTVTAINGDYAERISEERFAMANRIVLDFQGFTSEWDLHEYLQKQFAIPEYYGHNADALWDAVYHWFHQPTVIEVNNLDKLPAQLKTVREGLREVFQDLDQKDLFLQVVFRS